VWVKLKEILRVEWAIRERANSHPISKSELKRYIIFFLNITRSNTNIFKTGKYIVIELCSGMNKWLYLCIVEITQYEMICIKKIWNDVERERAWGSRLKITRWQERVIFKERWKELSVRWL